MSETAPFSVHTMDFTGSYYFVCKTATSNKWWKIEFQGNNTVCCTFARLGLQCSRPSVKSFSSAYAMRSFARKKIQEKLDEGYKHETEETVEHEAKVAKLLGTQYKIQMIKYVSKVEGKKIYYGDAKDYRPENGVVASIVNSWKPSEAITLWLTKDWAKEILGMHSVDDYWVVDEMQMAEPNFARGVREYLKQAARKVKQVINTFATLGNRVLFGEDEEESQGSQELIQAVSKQNPELGSQLVLQFAALGNRELVL
jgi:predicted DNA-binding WGR domain protein